MIKTLKCDLSIPSILNLHLGYQECLCVIEDIPDVDIRQKLIDIKNSKTEENFQKSLSLLSERFEYGYLKFNPSFIMKEVILKKIAHHFVISRNMEEIQQLIKGLSCGGILNALRQFPDEGMSLLVYNDGIVSYEALKSLLEPQFSTDEDDKCGKEEDVFYNLINFLDEVGNGRLGSIMVYKYEDFEDGTADSKMIEKLITVPDVLQFFTGSRHLSRFNGKIAVKFGHSIIGRVTVSTCNLEVVFPTTEAYTGPNFTKQFAADMIESPGFGLV